MVDRAARDRYAELLRHFASGRVTNREYEKAATDIPRSVRDPAIDEVFDTVWFVYDDIRTHRLTGRHALLAEARQDIARMVLFLQTDQEYGWPFERPFRLFAFACFVLIAFGVYAIADLRWYGLVLVPLSIALYITVRNHLRHVCQTLGDQDWWPFLHREDLDEARRHPRLLAGKPGE